MQTPSAIQCHKHDPFFPKSSPHGVFDDSKDHHIRPIIDSNIHEQRRKNAKKIKTLKDELPVKELQDPILLRRV